MNHPRPYRIQKLLFSQSLRQTRLPFGADRHPLRSLASGTEMPRSPAALPARRPD